jgi:hypothetical protein
MGFHKIIGQMGRLNHAGNLPGGQAETDLPKGEKFIARIFCVKLNAISRNKVGLEWEWGGTVEWQGGRGRERRQRLIYLFILHRGEITAGGGKYYVAGKH